MKPISRTIATISDNIAHTAQQKAQQAAFTRLMDSCERDAAQNKKIAVERRQCNDIFEA